MTRPKFRAWDKLNNKMLYGDELPSNLCPTNINEYFLDDNYEWLQYADSKDKNNVEIYCGDFVSGINDNYYDTKLSKPGKNKHEVVFIGGCFCYIVGEIINVLTADLEIVGNRFENSESLEDK